MRGQAILITKSLYICLFINIVFPPGSKFGPRYTKIYIDFRVHVKSVQLFALRVNTVAVSQAQA